MNRGSSLALSKKGRLTVHFIRVVPAAAIALTAAGLASAQYGGMGGSGGTGGGTSGGTYKPPSGGYSSTGKAVGIGAGAAAGAGLLFLATHRTSMTGCVQPAEDGLRLVDEKKNASYTLVPGDVYLKAGQRVQLQGKKAKDPGGAQTFTAKKLVKDLGSCGPAPAAAAQPSGH